jgi:hypothetical protein
MHVSFSLAVYILWIGKPTHVCSSGPPLSTELSEGYHRHKPEEKRKLQRIMEWWKANSLKLPWSYFVPHCHIIYFSDCRPMDPNRPLTRSTCG